MNTRTYAMAYTEVLELLSYLPQEDYERIPQEKIDFYSENKVPEYEYEFEYDETKPLNEQNISREANAIIVSLFRDYFATAEQKAKLNEMLLENERKHQAELQEKYNVDNMFNANKTNIQPQVEIPITPQQETNKTATPNNAMAEYKENIFIRILNKIKRLFRK